MTPRKHEVGMREIFEPKGLIVCSSPVNLPRIIIMERTSTIFVIQASLPVLHLCFRLVGPIHQSQAKDY